jgi:HSP20 family protein
VYETADSLVVKVELGGVRPDNLQVSLSPDARVLTISGAREEEDAERADRIRCYQFEIYFGPFERHFVLPSEVRIDREGITASYRDGFLVVRLSKRTDADSEVRTVTISEG